MTHILMNHLGLGMTAALLTLCVSRSTAETISSPDIRFAADGAVAGFYKTAGGPNLVDTAQPGRGFVVRTFTGAAIDAARLDRVEFHGDSLLATRDGQPPRLTFQVTRGGRYLALKLKRVEGLPAASLASLQFELNCAGTDVKVLSLDYMTRVQQQGGASASSSITSGIAGRAIRSVVLRFMPRPMMRKKMTLWQTSGATRTCLTRC